VQLREEFERGTGWDEFDLLYSRVTEDIALSARELCIARRRATIVALGTTGGSGITTLLLGLRGSIDTLDGALVTGAFVLSAVGTLLAAWDRLVKNSARWLQSMITLRAMTRLRLHMELMAARRDSGDEELGAQFSSFLDRYDSIKDA
jgi:hypothetical protein